MRHMVETQDTSISEVIDHQRIVDLPLNGRQATDLILLSGGAAMPPNAASRVVTTHDYVNSVGVSVSGGQINGNNYLLDGGDNNDSHSNINMPFPFPDALQEFNVQTNGISARYGLHPGSVVNVVTKQGGSSYHGDLFEFVRTPSLNAQNRFTWHQLEICCTAINMEVPLEDRSSKTNSSALAATRKRSFARITGSNTVYVPTQSMLNGSWAPCKNLTLNPSTYVAPALAYLKLIPISTDPCGKLVYSASSPSNEYQDLARIDWVRTPRNTIFGRYFILDFQIQRCTQATCYVDSPRLLDRSQSVVLGDQMTLSSTIINSIHFTYGRLAIHRSTRPTCRVQHKKASIFMMPRQTSVTFTFKLLHYRWWIERSSQVCQKPVPMVG